jgi:hypothetical protein
VCYRVTAFNELGDAAPSPAACTAPPAAPTDLGTTAVDERTVRLAWNDNSSVEDAYQVWLYWSYEHCNGNVCDGFSEDLRLVAELPAKSTTYSTDAHADYGVGSVIYWVAAIRDGGTSDMSNTVFVR